MNHSFNIEIAQVYGIEEAIILENIYFWLEKNRANGTNFKDNMYWTYNSQKALSELFPYMNRSKIQRVMKKLEVEELIYKGNYNEAGYDKTTWYTLSPLGYSLFKMNNALFKMNNRMSQNEQPIPYINTDINTDNNISKDIYVEMIQRVIEKWNSLNLSKIVNIKGNRLTMTKSRLKGYGEEQFLQAIENVSLSSFLKGQNRNSWIITYDWFIKPNNFPKVLEGNYTDKGGTKIDGPNGTNEDNTTFKGYKLKLD